VDSFIPFEDKWMYRLKRKPPKMDKPNDFIVLYKETGDKRYLSWFLHAYEPALNKRAENYCENYGQLHHFADIKQTIVATLIAALPKYDPDAGATLITYTDKAVDANLHDYIRQNCGQLIPSEYDYDILRTVMYIYGKPELTLAEKFAEIAAKTGLSEDKIHGYIHKGDLFAYSESLSGGQREGEDGYIPLIERIGDIYGSPEYLVLKKLFIEAVIAAVDKLPFGDNKLLLGFLGLERRGDGLFEVEPMSKEDIAARLHIGKAQTVDNQFRRVVAALRTELEKRGWIEGENTPKSDRSAAKEDDLSDIDRAVIDYATRKWRESGESAAIHVLLRDEWVDEERFVREFLKLWLY
jgi:DNA-directed RNA polymerase specialized sigma subunit